MPFRLIVFPDSEQLRQKAEAKKQRSILEQKIKEAEKKVPAIRKTLNGSVYRHHYLDVMANAGILTRIYVPSEILERLADQILQSNYVVMWDSETVLKYRAILSEFERQIRLFHHPL